MTQKFSPFAGESEDECPNNTKGKLMILEWTRRQRKKDKYRTWKNQTETNDGLQRQVTEMEKQSNMDFPKECFK